MFDQKQIAELKEAFSFIDANNDGLIDKEDLIDIWTSLGMLNISSFNMIFVGQDPEDEVLEEMIGATGPLNFTLFLTLMGERVQAANVSTEAELLTAFEHFDEHNTGKLTLQQLHDILQGSGPDRLTDEELDVLMRDVQTDSKGLIDYAELVKSIIQSC